MEVVEATRRGSEGNNTQPQLRQKRQKSKRCVFPVTTFPTIPECNLRHKFSTFRLSPPFEGDPRKQQVTEETLLYVDIKDNIL